MKRFVLACLFSALSLAACEDRGFSEAKAQADTGPSIFLKYECIQGPNYTRLSLRHEDGPDTNSRTLNFVTDFKMHPSITAIMEIGKFDRKEDCEIARDKFVSAKSLVVDYYTN